MPQICHRRTLDCKYVTARNEAVLLIGRDCFVPRNDEHRITFNIETKYALKLLTLINRFSNLVSRFIVITLGD
jgi:hypothetical protein